MTNTPTLKDVAQNVLDRHGISGRQLQRVAERQGLKIAYTTINHMAAGTYTSTPTMTTLNALASLSDYSVEEVYAAARQAAPSQSFLDRLPDSANRLTDAQANAVLGVIREYVRANDQIAAKEQRHAQDETANSQAPGSGADELAERREMTPEEEQESIDRAVKRAARYGKVEKPLSDQSPDDD